MLSYGEAKGKVVEYERCFMRGWQWRSSTVFFCVFIHADG